MDDDIILIIGIVLGILAIIAVVARFYARYLKKAGFRWDDWLILVAIIAMIITDVLAVYAISANPTGAETATVVTETQEYTEADQEYTKLVWSLTIVYFFTTSSTKLSILLMYHRLFSVSRTFQRQIIFLSILVGCWCVGCTIANLTNCIPLKYSWVNSLSDPRFCFNYNHYWFATGLVESSIDILIFLLPINAIRTLQFSRKQKFAISFVFLLGALVIISGLLKTGFGYIPGSRQPSFSNTQIWTTVHICTGIICACLPICWPLVTRLGNMKPQTWPGSSWIRKYWYSASGWASRERLRSTRPETEDKSFNKLTNNFTSRGFDVRFSQLENGPREDEYTLYTIEPHHKSSAV